MQITILDHPLTPFAPEMMDYLSIFTILLLRGDAVMSSEGI